MCGVGMIHGSGSSRLLASVLGPASLEMRKLNRGRAKCYAVSGTLENTQLATTVSNMLETLRWGEDKRC